MRFLYRCFTYVYVIPLSVAAVILWLSGRRDEIERLGVGLKQPDRNRRLLWFVASSVGEVTIAAKIIARLKSSTDYAMLLTVTTKTGRLQAEKLNCGADVIAYQPFDTPLFVKRFLRVYLPAKVILIETELWPTLMELAFGNGAEVMQISGRLTERSLRRYRPMKPLFRPLLRSCSKLLMQSEEDAERLRELAGNEVPIEVVGSAKGEYVPPALEELQRIKEYLCVWHDMIVFTCGSTRPGEEEILLDAFSGIFESHKNARLILAPRHLERMREVVEVVKKSGLNFCRRSEGALTRDTQVLLLDSIGELNLFYHCSDITFVGGTLAPLGGHNLLEPALAGCPVLFGPHFQGQLSGHKVLIQYKMGIEVTDAKQIADTIMTLMENPDSKKIYADRASQLRGANANIVDRYVSEIVS